MKKQYVLSVWLVTGCCRAQEVEANQHRQSVTPAFYGEAIHVTDLSTAAAPTNSAMFEIKSSGRYYVASDLSLAPGGNNLAGIRISASNVTLNVNAATLFQRSSNSATGFDGIFIAANTSNITIHNGKINGLNGTASIGITTAASAACSNITIRDMDIRNCGQGIYLIGASSSEIKSGKIERVSCQGCTGGIGCRLDYCYNLLVKDSSFNQNTTTAIVSGLHVESCVGCYFENCTANENVGVTQCYGIRLVAAAGNRFYKCRTLGNNTGSTAVRGFQIANVSLFNSIEDCEASYQTGASSTFGFFLANSSTGGGNILKNCRAIGNTSSSGEGHGFQLSDSGNAETYSSCIACGAYANRAGSNAYGMRMASGSSLCFINNCIANNNNGSTASYGFKDDVTDSTVLYVINFSIGHGANNYSVDPNGTGSFPTVSGTYANLSGVADAKRDLRNVSITT